MNRREFHRWGAIALGTLKGLLLGVPGLIYLLDPLRRSAGSARPHALARLDDLEVGVPELVPVVDERTDAWVTYPREPVGSVWLVRRADDTVSAYQAECPHLGCAINLRPDGKSFHCPCHTSSFDLDGKRLNRVPPRDMDALDCEVTGEDRRVVVSFRRFRTQTQEKIPLV